MITYKDKIEQLARRKTFETGIEEIIEYYFKKQCKKYSKLSTSDLNVEYDKLIKDGLND